VKFFVVRGEIKKSLNFVESIFNPFVQSFYWNKLRF